MRISKCSKKLTVNLSDAELNRDGEVQKKVNACPEEVTELRCGQGLVVCNVLACSFRQKVEAPKRRLP